MASTTSAIEIFCCHSHKDQDLFEGLFNQLILLPNYIKVSSDASISPGDNRIEEINKHIESADIILLLISPDFIASEDWSNIVTRVMERHAEEKASVVPIILRHGYYEHAPFSKIKPLPTDKRPVKSWPDHDEAFLDITRGIEKIAKNQLMEKYSRAANALYKDGKFEDALKICKKILLLDSKQIYIRWRMGGAYLRLRRYKEALSAYEETEQLDPTIATGYFCNDKGHVLEGLNRQEDALVCYQRAIETDPSIPYFYEDAVRLLLRLKRYDEALELYDQVIRLKPEETNYFLEKGRLLFYFKRYEEALTMFESLIEQDPHIAEAHQGKGFALINLKRYHEALPAFADATRFNPGDADSFRGQGAILFELGRYEEALAAVEQVILLDVNCADAYTSKGDALAKLQRYEDALDAYKQAIEHNPDEPANYRGKAFALERLAELAYIQASQLYAAQSTFTLYSHWTHGHSLVVGIERRWADPGQWQ